MITAVGHQYALKQIECIQHVALRSVQTVRPAAKPEQLTDDSCAAPLDGGHGMADNGHSTTNGACCRASTAGKGPSKLLASLTGSACTICLRPACLSAAHMLASLEASSYGSRLTRTVPAKMIGSCDKQTGAQTTFPWPYEEMGYNASNSKDVHSPRELEAFQLPTQASQGRPSPGSICTVAAEHGLKCRRKHPMHALNLTLTCLWDEREARAQVDQRHGGDVDAVDQDTAAGRLHHALERHHERALAAAGAPRDPHLLPPCAGGGKARMEIIT